MILRLAVVLGVCVLTAAAAAWWRSREGRFAVATGRFERSELGLGRRDKPSAVLVEFSGEHCAPCAVVQARVGKIAAELSDVAVVTIDAGSRLDLAGRYDVRRVPTLFVADADLRIVWRASGVPSEESIRRVLLGPAWAGRPQHAGAERPSPAAPSARER